MSTTVSFTAELWEHEGPSSWHFVTLTAQAGQHVREQAADGMRRGFGSVRVEATVGGTTWRTSVFPDTGSGSYVLPVKAAVRRAEDLLAGEPLDVRLLVEP